MLKKQIIIMDQNSDPSRAGLRKIANRMLDKEFSEMVWAIGTAPQQEKTASQVKFAWPEMNKFPVHTPEETILSKVYFEGQCVKLASEVADTVRRRLDTYIDLYGIPDSFQMAMIKKASDEGVYLLKSMGLYKVATDDDLLKAASEFEKDLFKFTLPERVEFSKEFVKTASSHVEIPEVVQRYCGIMETDMDNVRTLLEMRKVAAARAGKSGDEFMKLAAVLVNCTTKQEREDLEKLAEVIHSLDERYGFDSTKYDRKLPDAYATVFNKKASNKPEIDEVHEKDVSKAEVIARYGDEILDEVENPDGSINQQKLKYIAKLHSNGKEDAN